MGARNVSACFSAWPHLPHHAFRLLVGMALTALDNTSADGRPPRLYFGGEDAMRELLGGSNPAVYRALAALRKAGAIEVLDVGRSGHRAVYKLRLDVVEGAGSLSQVRGESLSQVRGTASRKWEAQPLASERPRKDLGDHEESPLGQRSPSAVVSPGAVDEHVARVIRLPRRSS